MSLLLVRVARSCELVVGVEPEWIQPIVMTGCCSGMLVASLMVLVVGG